MKRLFWLLLLPACVSPGPGETGKDPAAHDSAPGRDDSGPDDSGPDDSTPDTDTAPDTDDTAREDTAIDESGEPPDTGPFDADGDGAWDADDCEDGDASVYPGAPEDCDGVDDDCDGDIDEDAGSTWYPDADGDTEGDAAGALVACEAPAGSVTNALDCDDTDAAINTSAIEICGNGVDDDCDGALDETCVPSGALDTSVAQTTYETGVGSDFFGGRMTSVPDWTGDGVEDMVISAFLDDTVDTSAGAIYLFDGAATGALTAADAVAVSYGGGYSFAYGDSVTRAADLDGDGGEVLLVGATGWSWYPGRVAGSGTVTIVTGVSGAAFTESVQWEFYGEYAQGGKAACTADLDGDGRPEMIAGAPLYGYDTGLVTGLVQVVGSADVLVGGDIAASAVGLEGPAGSAAGYSLARADLDGDGDDELLVGSMGQATDVAWVLDGLPTGGDLADWATATFTGDTADYAGFATVKPDLDGDGTPDLVLTAPNDDTAMTDAGAVFVFNGSTTGSTPLTDARLVLTGESATAWAGSAVSTAGDLDDDGRDDLLVGAKWHGGSYDGRAYVVAGAPTGTVGLGTSWITFDPTVAQQLGFAVYGDTDFDADGYNELFLTELTVRYGASMVFRWSPAGG
jgi:hypothetical protein